MIRFFLLTAIVVFFAGNIQGQNTLTPEEMALARSNDFLLNQVFGSVDSKGSIADEIDLVASQREELDAISKKLNKRLRLIELEISTVQKNSVAEPPPTDETNRLLGDELAAKRTGLLFQANKVALEEISQCLLPKQMERLKQIAIQYEYSFGHGFGFELVRALDDKISLSKQEKESLEEVVRSARLEYDDELKKLRERLDKKVIGELSQEGQDRIKEMVGEFHYSKRIR